jgi:hypothetical protein
VRSAFIGKGKHVWIAVGDYLGKEIRAQAESEGAAVNAEGLHPSNPND